MLLFFFSVHLGISGILWFKFKFNCSLLVYRKEIAFLNINSVILQPCYNHLLVQEFFFFLSICLDFLHRQSHHLEQREFYCFLPNLYTVYFFFLPYCISKASIMILERSGERRYPCLVPDLSGKALHFSPLGTIWAVDFFCSSLKYQVENFSLYS